MGVYSRSETPIERAQPHADFRPWIWRALIVLCAIGSAAAIRRMVALAVPPQHPPTQLAGLDAVFANKRLATLTHIVPGLALLILIPFQFSRSFRKKYLLAHRWMGRAAMIMSLVIGVSALALLKNPVAGAMEVAAILVFDAIFLVSLAMAFWHIRKREVARHREWMIRAMSVAVGVATVRPIMAVFFATSRLTGWTPRQFFGIAFWIGFSLTYAVGEWWIRRTKSAAVVPSL